MTHGYKRNGTTRRYDSVEDRTLDASEVPQTSVIITVSYQKFLQLRAILKSRSKEREPIQQQWSGNMIIVVQQNKASQYTELL